MLLWGSAHSARLRRSTADRFCGNGGRRRRAHGPALGLEALEDRRLLNAGHWASTVLGYSSQYSAGDFAAAQALGAPDTPYYRDTPPPGRLRRRTAAWSTSPSATPRPSTPRAS